MSFQKSKYVSLTLKSLFEKYSDAFLPRQNSCTESLPIFSISFSANLITLELNEPANPRSLVMTMIPVFFTFLFSTNEISDTLICGKILQIKS